MTRTMTAMLVAFAVAGGSLALGTAHADEVTTSRTTTTTTSPAFGYEDGYWARNHEWHGWANPGERETFEKTYHAHYYSGMHTAAPDQGWREHDEYWESH